ncbi:RNA polymerase sigma factor [Sphingomonas faeni]|uniref:RNA polymerase sigma factor n=1 Tax=Sphingomonas faeni TaxID=185950 RepID=UPI0027804872|nr:RNA polymerase sigma factor [Sphingomonas faeni]MDQ0839257.1 RNA polymerase sigma factor (sigma-70 family) [Sphingomonas faeni]
MSSKTGGRDHADGTALDALYREHSAWLVRRLRRVLGRHADAAEDIAHDAYLRIARYAADEAGRHPRALLGTVGLNLSRDYVRRAGHRQSFVERNAGHGFARTEASQESDLALRDAILSLPPLYRDAFLMSRFTPLTNKEIGARLNISVKTVEWRISRAVEICAAHVLQEGEDR